MRSVCAIPHENEARKGGKKGAIPTLRYYLERVLRNMGGGVLSRTGPLSLHSVGLLRHLMELLWGVQNNYRQTSFLRAINSNYRYRIVLSEELISITEREMWEC